MTGSEPEAVLDGPEVVGELGISATEDNRDGLSLLVCNAGGRLLEDRALKMLSASEGIKK